MTTDSDPANPIVKFFQLVPNSRAPQRADKAVGGTIPVRALRYCEPLTSASGFGWYVFLPMEFELVFDGHEILWTYDGVDRWLRLDVAQYPGFSEQFDQTAPPHVRGFSPPFLSRSMGPQPGGIQIWTGCIAQSAPGWSLLVRSVANLASSLSVQMFEGIIETDEWFGPLFINLRIIKTDVPIQFRDDIPFLQLQPVRKEVYGDQFLQNFETRSSVRDLTSEEWDMFHRTVVIPGSDPGRRPGRYAVAARKRLALTN